MTYPYSGPPSGPQPPQPYGQPGMGGMPQYPNQYGGFPGQPSLADWGTRFLGYLIDGAIPAVGFMILYFVGLFAGAFASFGIAATGSKTAVTGAGIVLLVIFGVLYLAIIGFSIWNLAYRRGTTGQTIGQKAVKIRTVREETGQPLGFGMAFVRQLCHLLDNLICCFPLGFLWPLWDDKRQTWADKIVKSVVVHTDPVQAGPMPPSGPMPGYPGQGQPYGYGSPGQPPYPH